MDVSAPSILRPQIQIPITKSIVISIYLVELILYLLLYCENERNKQKETGICPFFKTILQSRNIYLVLSTKRVRE